MGWGTQWRRFSVVHLDELLFDVRTDRLRLGVSLDQRDPVDVSLGWSRRHILLVGPNGKGATVALEHYMGQHLAMDGGLLVLDTSPNEGTPRLLERVAKVCGRNDFKHYRHDLPEGERLTDIDKVVSSSRAAYVTLPLRKKQDAVAHETDLFVEQLEALAQTLRNSLPADKTRPFMLVVPDGGWLLTDAWASLLQNARAYNLTLVIRLHSLADLQGMSASMVDSILNFGTKLFLQPSSPTSLEESAKVLTLSQDPKKLATVRVQLAALGLGEALMAGTTGEPTLLRLCMLVPEPLYVEEFAIPG